MLTLRTMRGISFGSCGRTLANREIFCGKLMTCFEPFLCPPLTVYTVINGKIRAISICSNSVRCRRHSGICNQSCLDEMESRLSGIHVVVFAEMGDPIYSALLLT